VQELALESPSGGLCLGLCPVDPSNTSPIVPTIRVFFVVDDDAGVQE
jgi:hypothetical protein